MRIAVALVPAAGLTAIAASNRVGQGQGQTRSARELLVRSPDSRTVVTIDAGGQLRWSATRDGRPLVAEASAGLTVEGRVLGRGAVRDAREQSADEIIAATFYARRRSGRDRYRQLTVTLDDGLSLVMRAYDDLSAGDRCRSHGTYRQRGGAAAISGRADPIRAARRLQQVGQGRSGLLPHELRGDLHGSPAARLPRRSTGVSPGPRRSRGRTTEGAGHRGRSHRLAIPMAPGGGWVARIRSNR